MACFHKVLKCIFSPFLLLWYSLTLYCLPCVAAYGRRPLRVVYCCALWVRCCCCGCCKYTDKKFPASPSSLGPDYKGDLADVEWRRSAVILKGRGCLIAGALEPADVQQGDVGNCWLMSAFACLAEYPGVIRGLFKTKEHSLRGKYQVRIYDQPAGKWHVVAVDDLFPCSRKANAPLFAKPAGNELWVMVYEKAFAKYCGSYQGLTGGNTVWALQAMTGDPVFKLTQQADGTWRRLNLTHLNPEAKGSKQGCRAIGLLETKEVYSPDQLFSILLEYAVKRACLAASSTPGTDSAGNATQGIVKGHAYSVLQVVHKDGMRLLRLRNPWGSFEWKGAWGDGSPLWDAHPAVKRACKYTAADDGCFWMAFEDFTRHFWNVDVCDRSHGIHDLALDLGEDRGLTGPCRGCCCGCLKFWCCCQGFLRLMCAYTATGDTRQGRRCCCCRY